MEKNLLDSKLKNLETFILNSSPDISYSNFIIAILVSAFLALIIKSAYIKLSRSLNDREYFSDIFIPLAIITTLVITVIKFSLALSLGLVGALSIVRFRAAIKEPEELVYLFFIIGIGLANGANQFLVSIICTFFIIIILFSKKYYDDKKKNKNFSDSSVNVMQIEITDDKDGIEKVIENLKSETLYLKLKSFRVEKNISQYVFWFDVGKDKINTFMKAVEKLKTNKENISIHVYSRTGIYE
jgi:uncharacterized membrane protein YhiD involved in acid resistance|tara:strand:- start:124 stop:849 length:726 start_codon:yes stop_codon:yes gene_type:complete